MREFVLRAHDLPAADAVSLEDLPGAGRLDLIARTVVAALLTSHGIREDVIVWVAAPDDLTIRFEGRSLQGLNPDERSTAARLRTALAAREELVGRVPVDVAPGLDVRRQSFSALLADRSEAGHLVRLGADGTPITEMAPDCDPVFVCSDHHAFTEAERATVADHADAVHSLGPTAVHADQAVAVAHNYCDTAGYEQY